MTPGESSPQDPGAAHQAGRWDVPQWEPITQPVAPPLSPWRCAARAVLGAQALVLTLLAATMLLGSGYIRGQPDGLASAAGPTPRPSASTATIMPAAEPTMAPASAPGLAPPASATPSRVATAAATATPLPTTEPSATPTTTQPPSPTPSPTEDTSLVVVAAPTAPPSAGSEPAPTVVYPIGPPPVRLAIPSIGLDTPVVTVGTVRQSVGGRIYEVWDTVANAAAYHKTSAPPGYVGNTVINGHRDIHGKVFADLDKVVLGDPIIVHTEDHEFVYIVSQILEVPEKHATAAQRAENQRLIGYIPEERLTLITCTPYGTNLNRLLIIGRRAGQPRG